MRTIGKIDWSSSGGSTHRSNPSSTRYIIQDDVDWTLFNHLLSVGVSKSFLSYKAHGRPNILISRLRYMCKRQPRSLSCKKRIARHNRAATRKNIHVQSNPLMIHFPRSALLQLLLASPPMQMHSKMAQSALTRPPRSSCWRLRQQRRWPRLLAQACPRRRPHRPHHRHLPCLPDPPYRPCHPRRRAC